MAINKRRYINTKFWNDNYVSELDSIGKLLFIYFLTNEHTNISGIYELPLKVVAMETGIDKKIIEETIPLLSDKMGYIRGFVVIKNFLKHQETKSPLTLKGIDNCLSTLDQDFLKDLILKGLYIIDDIKLEGVYKGYTRVSKYLYLDLDSNSILSLPEEGITSPEKITKTNTQKKDMTWKKYEEEVVQLDDNYKEELVENKKNHFWTEEEKKEWIKNKVESPNDYDALIGAYFQEYSSHELTTKPVAESIRMKNLIASKFLVKNFTNEQISKTLKFCKNEFTSFNWDLNTVRKQITNVISK